MSIPIRDYLAQRRTDIQAQIKTLRVELAEVDVAERALALAANESLRPKKERGTDGSGKKTLKEMAVEVLQDHPDGAEASVILTEIEKRWGLTVRRESLSPQLSRLGADKTLVREGLVWKLAQFDWTIHPDIKPAVALASEPPTALDQLKLGTQRPKDETPGVQPPSASGFEVDLDDEIPF